MGHRDGTRPSDVIYSSSSRVTGGGIGGGSGLFAPVRVTMMGILIRSRAEGEQARVTTQIIRRRRRVDRVSL